MNLKIKQLEMQLVNDINESGIDIAVISLILEKLLNESKAVLQQELIKEQELLKEQENHDIKNEKESL